MNNYDERDLTIFQNGYPDYCRHIVYTLEMGEAGTPHIQAWVRLQRQQRMSFLKKLFPGGHFKPLTSDEYIHNTKLYAQKKDGTTMSASTHLFNDPLHTLESVVKQIGIKMNTQYDSMSSKGADVSLMSLRRDVEKDMVATDYRYAKVMVSSTYKAMWKEFGPEILMNIVNTHTHTHTDERLARRDSITDVHSEPEGQESDGDSERDGDSVTEGEGEEDAPDTEGSVFESCEEDDCEEGGEQGDW